MNRRKELVEQFKEIKTEAGVYKFENNVNKKVFVASTNNFKSLNGKKMTLDMGTHMNRELQEDWTKYGGGAFTVEILEVMDNKKDSVYFDMKKELKKLEDKWIDKLQPFGDRGYHGPAPEGE
ncbi:GIY-YIG nuclease family protein [Paenibacillus hemerocallicola]|jgi:hypothetical protein|uniref:GIY-YIG nuclease family protein n=1 Tax=Paenibacillus hemerocallicola TaxID=1172614 RepID=A0A5C4T2Z5_9BACL|nr:GIY-YIG nuclease family protein [Paenibacillus hemerocallicola]TNJ63444.1 GIY-YIG nuclease family protein [Paenibacillus hemerocallicola]